MELLISSDHAVNPLVRSLADHPCSPTTSAPVLLQPPQQVVVPCLLSNVCEGGKRAAGPIVGGTLGRNQRVYSSGNGPATDTIVNGGASSLPPAQEIANGHRRHSSDALATAIVGGEHSRPQSLPPAPLIAVDSAVGDSGTQSGNGVAVSMSSEMPGDAEEDLEEEEEEASETVALTSA